jgi:methylisocitrate lyase
MVHQFKSAEEIRKEFRNQLDSGLLLQLPGAINALSALLIEKKQFDGIYLSGGVISNSLGLADVGLTTLTEVCTYARSISSVTNLPIIIDGDTGFGKTMNVVRTVQEMEFAGLSGCHFEDQVSPKRCGHLDNKELVTAGIMAQKIRAAVLARKDENFLVIARTDSRAKEGLQKSIDRAKAYQDAGADVIFPEALKDITEFETFRKALDIPLLANMTEFGKSKILDKDTLSILGYNLVIYPVTLQRLAMSAMEKGLDEILKNGSQQGVVKHMQTRQELYDLLRYEDYNRFDQDIFNFKLKNNEKH